MPRNKDLTDVCQHCKKEIQENDHLYLIALAKLKKKKLNAIENYRPFHTWCFEEVAGEEYAL